MQALVDRESENFDLITYYIGLGDNTVIILASLNVSFHNSLYEERYTRIDIIRWQRFCEAQALEDEAFEAALDSSQETYEY